MQHRHAVLIPAAISSARSHSVTYHELSNSEIQLPLLIWFAREKRFMPWRKFVQLETQTLEERNQRAYEIWVSEIMLQQTKVAAVVEYHNRWMTALPTLEALANAKVDEVRALWAGLGYYSRGSRLLLGAQKIMNEFSGNIPSTKKELLTIDGIGPYTASAVSSIGFAAKEGVVDGNVSRVISRLAAIHSLPTAKASINLINDVAQDLCPSNKNEKLRTKLSNVKGTEELLFNLPGAFNQAMMELGATVCSPTSPNCGQCPVSSSCLAFAEVEFSKSKSKSTKILVDIEDLCTICDDLHDDASSKRSVTMYPMKKIKKVDREEESFVWIVEWQSPDVPANRKVAIFQRPETGLLAGLYEYPTIDLPPSSPSTPSSRKQLSTSFLSSLFAKSLPTVASKDTNLGSIQQVYSGQKRIYHLHHLLITSPELPKLSIKKTKETGKEHQSLIGNGKWVNSKETSETFSNVGKRIWAIVLSGKREVFVTSTKGKGKQDQKKNVQTKLSFKKKVELSESELESDQESELSEVEEKKKVWKGIGKKRAEIDEEQENIQVEKSEEIFVAKKKRRIVLDSDEEE